MKNLETNFCLTRKDVTLKVCQKRGPRNEIFYFTTNYFSTNFSIITRCFLSLLKKILYSKSHDKVKYVYRLQFFSLTSPTNDFYSDDVEKRKVVQIW